MRAEKSVGRAMASSSALVCSDWVWPRAAASASMQVRGTLLKTSCAARLHPEVWQWVRSAIDLAFLGPNPLMSLAQSTRAARILAISMKWFIPMPQKKLRRGANSSTESPAWIPVRRYSSPSASVYPSSMSAVAPASCMW